MKREQLLRRLKKLRDWAAKIGPRPPDREKIADAIVGCCDLLEYFGDARDPERLVRLAEKDALSAATRREISALVDATFRAVDAYADFTRLPVGVLPVPPARRMSAEHRAAIVEGRKKAKKEREDLLRARTEARIKRLHD